MKKNDCIIVYSYNAHRVGDVVSVVSRGWILAVGRVYRVDGDGLYAVKVLRAGD
jgi:hypothetical protein